MCMINEKFIYNRNKEYSGQSGLKLHCVSSMKGRTSVTAKLLGDEVHAVDKRRRR